MLKNMARSKSRSDLVTSDILERAATLFAERGYSGTSLREVADAIGISRSALYHYVSSKEDLFAQLVSGITRERADDLAEIRADGTARPLEKVDAAVRALATRVARNPARFRLLIISEASLPEWVREEHGAGKRELMDHLSAIIAEGIDSGVLKTVDEHIAASMVLGMCNWIAWWYHPDHGVASDSRKLSTDEVATLVSTVALDGLKRDRDCFPQEGDGDNVSHALDVLRQDLGYLERLLR